LRAVNSGAGRPPMLGGEKEAAMHAIRPEELEGRSPDLWCWTLCALVAVALVAIFFYVLLPFLSPVN
jgi:hypothetical protein